LLPAVRAALRTTRSDARTVGVKPPAPGGAPATMALTWGHPGRAPAVATAGASTRHLALRPLAAMRRRLAMPSHATLVPDALNRSAYDIAAEEFGPGRNAPMIAFVDTLAVPEEERPVAWATAAQDIQAIDGVSNAQIIEPNEAGDAAQVLITPEYGATDERAADVLESIRAGAGDFEAQ